MWALCVFWTKITLKMKRSARRTVRVFPTVYLDGELRYSAFVLKAKYLNPRSQYIIRNAQIFFHSGCKTFYDKKMFLNCNNKSIEKVSILFWKDKKIRSSFFFRKSPIISYNLWTYPHCFDITNRWRVPIIWSYFFFLTCAFHANFYNEISIVIVLTV